VGNKVNLVVATTDAGAVSVATSQTATVTFTITNTGNAYQKYLLSYTDFATTETPSVFGADRDDNFDADASSITTQVASVATTTTTAVAPNASLTVTIVGTVPSSGLTEGWYDVLALKAQAVNPITGAVETNNSTAAISIVDGSDTACTSDIVLGDGTGSDDTTGDKDGMYSARSAYIVHLPSLTVSKASLVACDPFNGCGASAKAIPGATIEYRVVITNAASPAPTAQNVTITDTISSNMTPTGYTAGWTASATFGGSKACAANQYVYNNNGAGWSCGSDFWDTATPAKGTAVIGDIASGATATVVFRATIN
jgi:uncharacterized repeat protein (TIGR01451 family)